jgi:hypothetical protein
MRRRVGKTLLGIIRRAFVRLLLLSLLFSLLGLVLTFPEGPTTAPISQQHPTIESYVTRDRLNSIGIPLITALISLAGFASTTVLLWFRERRDKVRYVLDIEKQKLDIERLRLEIRREQDRIE